MINIPDNIFDKNTDGADICPKCKQVLKQCTCPAYDPNTPKVEQYNVTTRIDKSNRRGKLVTLIEHLPGEEAYLKRLIKILKSKTGAGGTFYVENSFGTIEIQGNHQSNIEKILINEGFSL